MDTSKKTILEWPYSKDSENIAGYLREMEYVPEKTNEILKYYEKLDPKCPSPSDSSPKLERSLNNK